jgi:hypothetical protein
MDTPDIQKPMLRTIATIVGWIGSWQLGEIQTLVGIVSGLVVTGYALTQWYVLWRDKVTARQNTEPEKLP